MVKKLMTGLAISVGAGLAITATNRAKGKTPWHPATNDGSMTPVTIRVHTAAPRGEHGRPEEEQEMAMASSPARSAELGEVRVMIEALDTRCNELLSSVNQRIDELQSHLPRFIDVKVTSRLREAEERLRAEFQEEQSRTLDAFLKTLDQKVLPRISAVEEAAVAQREEMDQMRQRIEKTDETLVRLLDRVEVVVASIGSPAVHEMAKAQVREINQKAVA